MGAWEKFCELQGCEFHEMMNTGIFPIEENQETGQKEVHFNPFVLNKLFYAAYLYNCEYEGEAVNITVAKSKEWLDFLISNNEQLQEITKAIANSLAMGESKKKDIQESL